MAPTRSRQTVSIGTKIKIIDERRKGHSNTVVANQFNLSKSTVSTIWGQRENIEKSISKCETPNIFLKKSYLSTPTFDKVDQACYEWMKEQRGQGISVSGPLLQTKALLLVKELYPEGYKKFEASSGWLTRFKKRHGIYSPRSKAAKSESLEAVSTEPFLTELKKVIEKEGLTRDQLFNADETSLYWRLLPNQLEGRKNNKTSKDRVTLLGCANASGTCKLPLTFIHEAAVESISKHDQLEDLPVDYYTQKNSWMDADVFKSWFFDKFVPYVQAFCIENNIPEKIILVLDNALAHPSEDELSTADGNVRVMYLSVKESYIQPMTQGILQSLKYKYKKNLLQHVLCQNSTRRENVIKKLMIVDAMYWSANAWIEITQENFAKSWARLLEDEDVPQGEDIEQQGNSDQEYKNIFEKMFEELQFPEGINVEEWLDEDSGDPATRHKWLITAKNAGRVKAKEETEPEKEGNSGNVEPKKAFQAVQTVMQWLEQFDDTDPAFLRQLRKWRDRASEMAFQ